MFSSLKRFIIRNKRKFIFIGVFIGSSVMASKLAKNKFIEWQEKETKELLERSRKQQYFESSEKTCNQTIILLSSTLRDNILQIVNCEDVIKNLREGVGNKVTLWQELKLLVFTKVSLLIYSGTLLVLALRIQLNIIGGHIFSQSVFHDNNDLKAASDFQEKYLAKCHYFLNEGVRELHSLIQNKVEVALKDVTLKQNLSLQQIENIFWAIQSSVNEDPKNPLRNMPQLLYGNDFLTKEEDLFMKEVMLDTVELLQSAEIVNIASSCISRGFSSLMDKIADFFSPEENSLVSSHLGSNRDVRNVKFINPNKVSKPLAKVVPIVNGFGNPGTFDSPDAWISPFIYMEKVKTLGANIYESFCC